MHTRKTRVDLAADQKAWHGMDKDERAAHHERYKDERAAYREVYREADRRERAAYRKAYVEKATEGARLRTVLEELSKRMKADLLKYMGGHGTPIDASRKGITFFLDEGRVANRPKVKKKARSP